MKARKPVRKNGPPRLPLPAVRPARRIDFVELDLGKIHALMQQVVEQGDPDFALRGRLAGAMGARPSREKQLAAIELARAVVADRMRGVSHAQIPAMVEAHGELVRLAGQAPTYNFDPGLLVMEIGTLLANARRLLGTPANG